MLTAENVSMLCRSCYQEFDACTNSEEMTVVCHIADSGAESVLSRLSGYSICELVTSPLKLPCSNHGTAGEYHWENKGHNKQAIHVALVCMSLLLDPSDDELRSTF